MRTLIAGAALLAGMSSALVSAEEIVCGEEGQSTYYQDIVDDGCTVIAGILRVEELEIENLNALSNVTSADFIRIVRTPLLKDINALSNLTSLGIIQIGTAPLLEDIDALSNLTSAIQITLVDVPALTNVNGLSKITGLSERGAEFAPLLESRMRIIIKNVPLLTNVDGLSSLSSVSSLSIEGAPLLTDIDGLSNLTRAGSIEIRDLPLLTNVDGLSSLTIAQMVVVDNTGITNVDGLSPLTTFTQTQAPDGDPINNGLFLSQNTELSNLDGLTNLTTIDEGGLVISGNSALTDLDGLKNLTTVGGVISISSNSKLASIDGLKNLDTDSRVTISRNDELGNCGAVAPLALSGASDIFRVGVEGRGPRGANGLALSPKVVINGIVQTYGGNANTVAGCIEDYVPQTSSERVNDLIETTTQMNLANGIANAYDSKLTSAFSALNDTNTKNDGAAFNKLYAFIYSVEAQRGGKLTDSEADLLIASAMRVIDNLPE
ncbi:hypothetical protein [Marinobacter alexandrii]|uniref:hypothetical protein n=1 Tax=Marinobacter alexandrii TaxID=2570351 RepID=UPI003297DDE2